MCEKIYLKSITTSLIFLFISGCSFADLPSDEISEDQSRDRRVNENDLALSMAPSLGWTLEFVNQRGLFDIWGTAANDIFAVGGTSGTESIIRYDGIDWMTQVDGAFPLREFGGVWGFAPNDVFAVGGQFPGSVAHYDGSSWTIQYSGNTLDGFVGVWGSSPTNVFAVGTNSGTGHGIIIHFDGIQWTPQFETSNVGENFRSVWGSGPNDVFVVGAGGSIFHYDGSAWTRQTSGTTSFLNDVWGSSSSDVFAVGGNGEILHYDGVSWSAQVSPTTAQYATVWGFGPSDVYAAGDSGVDGEIHYYDGSSWTTLPTAFNQPITSLWGVSNTEMFAVSQFGQVYHSQSLVTTLVVDVDIKPGSNTNPINLKSNGNIPVAILTTSTFDASSIDPLSVQFGPDGAFEVHAKGHIEDVNGDGLNDMVLHFKTKDTGIEVGDTEACLTGSTLAGDDIEGCDSITVK